jgi:Protein involved in cell division
MNDPYLYGDCDVLKNKFGVKDSDVLDKIEVEVSCNAIYEISVAPIIGNYDFEHLCRFHAHIFGDIYEWAGNARTVHMEKAEPVLGYMSIEYSKPSDIEQEASKVLERMNTINWEVLSLDERAKELSDCLAKLWKTHPFREGNTRTIITFICQFADGKEMPIDRELFEKNAAYTRNALVAATAIFSDGDYRKPEFLFNIVKDSLERAL